MNEWEQLFQALDGVFANVSSLLLDAERMLGARGYVIDHGARSSSAIYAEQSYSVSAPEWWYPGWMSRQFRSKAGTASARPYICVLMHARAGDDYETLHEPMVTAGVLRLPEGIEWGKRMAKAWAWTPERRTDGVPVLLPFKDGGEAEVLAVPLASITGAPALERKVIEPLTKLSRGPQEKP